MKSTNISIKPNKLYLFWLFGILFRVASCHIEAMMAIIGMFFQACRFSLRNRHPNREAPLPGQEVNLPTTILFRDNLLFLSMEPACISSSSYFFKVRNLFHRKNKFWFWTSVLQNWMRLPSKRSMFRVSKSAPLEGVWVCVGFSVPLFCIYFFVKDVWSFSRFLDGSIIWVDACKQRNHSWDLFRILSDIFQVGELWPFYQTIPKLLPSWRIKGGLYLKFVKRFLRLKSKPQHSWGDIHARKLTWKWKNISFNRRYIFKWVFCHCHVSFRGI